MKSFSKFAAVLTALWVLALAGGAEPASLPFVYTGTIDEISAVQEGLPGDPPQTFSPAPILALGDEWTFTVGLGSYILEVGGLSALLHPSGAALGNLGFAFQSAGVAFSDPLLIDSHKLDFASLFFIGGTQVFEDPFLFLVPLDPRDFASSGLRLVFIDTRNGFHGLAISHRARLLTPEPGRAALILILLGVLVASRRKSGRSCRALRVGCVTLIVTSASAASAAFCPDPFFPTEGVQNACGSIPGCYTMAVVADTQLLVDGCPKLDANGVCEFVTPGSTDPNTFANSLDQQDYAKFVTLVDWLLANRGPSAENIQFVVHVGDIIDTSRNVPVPDFCGNVCATTTQNIFLPSGCQEQGIPIPCCAGPQESNCPGDSCQCRQLPQSLIEWQRFDAQWKRLDQAALPYAIVLGNHDSPGILPASYCPTDATTYAGRDLVGSGFFSVFPPARLAKLPGYVGSHVQCSALNGFQQVKARRGPSHAWRFSLGPYSIGVLGVTEGFARRVSGDQALPCEPSGDPACQDFTWAQGMIDGPFATLPVVVAAHQHFDFGQAGAPMPHWKSIVGPNFPEVSVAPMGHYATEFALRDRDVGAPNPATRVLHMRSDGFGKRTGASVNNQGGQVDSFTKPSVILVRFILKPPGGPDADEAEMIAIYDPATLSNRSSWVRWFCQPFSLFYGDHDRDGVLSSAENCPLVYNPSQNADACDCDLNANQKLDGGDALLALRLATGDLVNPTLAGKADLAPHPVGDTDVDMGDVNRMLRAIQGEFAQGCVP